MCHTFEAIASFVHMLLLSLDLLARFLFFIDSINKIYKNHLKFLKFCYIIVIAMTKEYSITSLGRDVAVGVSNGQR